jgi:hypothetical protein
MQWYLYLGPNEHFEYPSSLYQLSRLAHLYLNDWLSSPAPSLQNIGDLTKLQGLDLHNNFFEGTLSSHALAICKTCVCFTWMTTPADNPRLGN